MFFARDNSCAWTADSRCERNRIVVTVSNRVLARNHCSVSRDHRSLVCRISCSRNLFSHLKLFCWKKRFLTVKRHLFRNFYPPVLPVFLRTCLGDEFVLINLLKVFWSLSSQVVLCKPKMKSQRQWISHCSVGNAYSSVRQPSGVIKIMLPETHPKCCRFISLIFTSELFLQYVHGKIYLLVMMADNVFLDMFICSTVYTGNV